MKNLCYVFIFFLLSLFSFICFIFIFCGCANNMIGFYFIYFFFSTVMISIDFFFPHALFVSLLKLSFASDGRQSFVLVCGVIRRVLPVHRTKVTKVRRMTHKHTVLCFMFLLFFSAGSDKRVNR